MAAVGDVAERTDRPAYVRFKRVAVEDKAASLAAGHYVAKDVDYVLITPPYSKDVVEVKAVQWLTNLEQDVRQERLPAAWAKNYREAYEAFKNGQEQPLQGTAIKGWGVISPAQAETLIRMNVLTVEDLAGINDEGMRRIGMGGMDLKNKARAWLAQLADKGPLTIENAAQKQEIELLKSSIATMERHVAELKAQVQSTPIVAAVAAVTRDEQITADDILPEPEKPTKIKPK